MQELGCDVDEKLGEGKGTAGTSEDEGGQHSIWQLPASAVVGSSRHAAQLWGGNLSSVDNNEGTMGKEMQNLWRAIVGKVEVTFKPFRFILKKSFFC